MKRILLIILISFLGKDLIGQAITKRAGASITASDENLFVGKSFRVPAYTDTTAANLAVTLDSCGKIIYTYDVDGYWGRGCYPKKWVRLGSGGGGTLDSAYILQQISDSIALKWNKSGNAGTNVSSDYVGTSDAVDLSIRTKGVERLRLDTNGRITIKNIANFQTRTGGVNVWEAYGNSITYGEVVGTDSTYAHKGANYFGLTYTNNAVSGSGVFRAILNQQTSQSLTHTNLSSNMAGLNDARRVGLSALGYNKIVYARRTWILNYWLAAGYANGGNGTNVTRFGGGWVAPYNASGFYARTTAAGLSQNVNDSITYTFTDSSVVIGLIGSGGVTHTFSNDVEVYIDGVLQYSQNCNNIYDNQNDGAYGNNYGPFSIHFSGLSYGSHKVKLINKNANFLIVDFFGHLRTDITQQPLMLAIPYLNAAGYLIAPNSATSPIIDVYNQGIDSINNTISARYRAINVPTNTYYNVATGISGDNIHPSQVGQNQIYDGMLTFLTGVITNTYDTGDFLNYNYRLYFQDTAELHRIAFTDDADTWVKINPTTQQSGNLNISGGATTSIIAGLLSVGNAALENTSTALRVITGSATNLHVLGASSRVYLDASSDDRSTAKPMYLTASEINMNNGVFHLSTNGSIGIGTNSPSADAKIEIRKDVNITANNYSAHMRFAGLTNPSVQLNMGFDTLSNTGFLQATNNPTSFLNLSLSPLGGNVAVGDTMAKSTLQVNGSFSTGYVAKTANYTATIDDYTINCTANTFAVTLPASTNIVGRFYTITNSGAGTITIDANAETFTNVVGTPTTLTMATVGTRVIQATGAGWLLISSL